MRAATEKVVTVASLGESDVSPKSRPTPQPDKVVCGGCKVPMVGRNKVRPITDSDTDTIELGVEHSCPNCGASIFLVVLAVPDDSYIFEAAPLIMQRNISA